MTPFASTSAPESRLLRGSLAQRLRILSGLILFAFVLTHLLNHALGLVSIEAMETVQGWRTAITQSTLGQSVLVAALLTHLTLNLAKIARRTTWRMSFWEAAQIGLGLAIPVLLFPHAAFMVGLRATTESEALYSDRLPGLWDGGLRQTVFVLVVWVHGCIGCITG
jgi:adenylate cyclase